VWLNESGAPVWDDYPGPTWTAANPDQRQYRLTMQQQASYVIQSTAYAWAAGADVVFFHQLYDDCGNQSGGTDFAPGGGAGDAHGLFRNERGSSCFSQHPAPGSARPSATTFHLMSRVFGIETFSNGTILDLERRAVVISFDRLPALGAVTSGVGGRIYVMWNRGANPLNVVIPSAGGLATLYTMDNQDFTIASTAEGYKINLPPVSQTQDPSLPFNEIAAWGGQPMILVEQFTTRTTPVNPLMIHLEGSAPDPNNLVLFDGSIDPNELLGFTHELGTLPPPAATLPPTDTPVPTIRPTTDPAFDTTPPRPYLYPLPEISPPQFTVIWGADEDGGVQQYVVWVRVDGGEWSPWQETNSISATYSGEVGRRYEFAVWAVDLAGNWSVNTVLSPMVGTDVR
jgi:hypothetical protein